MQERMRTYCRQDGILRTDTGIPLAKGRYNMGHIRPGGIRDKVHAVAATAEVLAYARAGRLVVLR